MCGAFFVIIVDAEFRNKPRPNKIALVLNYSKNEALRMIQLQASNDSRYHSQYADCEASVPRFEQSSRLNNLG